MTGIDPGSTTSRKPARKERRGDDDAPVLKGPALQCVVHVVAFERLQLTELTPDRRDRAECYDLANSWGPSDFDVRHRFAGRVVYELPFGSGAWRSGWQVAAILQCQCGNPLNIVTSGSSVTGIPNTVRPDVTGPIETIGEVQRWFDPSVFVVADGFGNLPRNAVVGPRFDNLDVSLGKAIHVTAGTRVAVQADVFNVLNHPNLGKPGRIVGSPNFGVITNTRFPTGDSGSSRQVQLAVRFIRRDASPVGRKRRD